jgi:hypothetical protein
VRRRATLLVLVLAACGDNDAVRDAGAADASTACAVMFSGNFVETSSADSCSTVMVDAVGDATLALTIPTMALSSPLNASIDLGTSPSTGEYSSELVATWRARGVKYIGTGYCVYEAGMDVVPSGFFMLHLGALDVSAGTAHGELELTAYVLALPGIDCGSEDTEQLHVRF